MTDWIKTSEASEIMTKTHGRNISPGIVRNLARTGKVRSKIDEEHSIVLVNKEDVEAYHVARRTDKRKTSDQANSNLAYLALN